MPTRNSSTKLLREICVICGWLCGKLCAMRLGVLLLAVLTLAISLVSLPHAGAQTTRPILISHPDSTRAIAFESVTRQREPFTTAVQLKFGADSTTRVMLFAMNLQLQPGETASAVTADAEDANHTIYPLSVENVDSIPDQPWASAVVIKLPENLPQAGDVLVRIRYRDLVSNRVRVGIGHVGDGPPDDLNAGPTPGISNPIPPTNIVAATNLAQTDVQTILQQAASAATALGKPVNIVVTDREGTVLGFLPMPGTPTPSTIRSVGRLGQGLEGTVVPAAEAATAKAATAAFFSTSGNAFTTRTAGFIIQEHFPPGISFRAGGPLYGVQFSSLPCSDIKKPSARLGLSADPGRLPIYKNGLPAGGIGIEGDGLYTVDRDPADNDQPFEEVIAVSAIRGFAAPAGIRGDTILVDGIRLPFSNITTALVPSTVASIAGSVVSAAPASEFIPQVVGGISGEVSPRFFPFIAGTAPGGNALTAAEVQSIIARAAQQANITRAAIRHPLGSNARGTIDGVDSAGVVLGVFRQQDAPVFGFDVAVQKARTAAFFSGANAATALRTAGFGAYVDRAQADGLRFDGWFAFTDRATGFLHRPFFADGINDTAAGPFSTEIADWSPFKVGLQLDLVKTTFLASVVGPAVSCTTIPSFPNGIQIFPGSVPLYKNGVLVGAIGISGDGVDQDDLIAAAGANGFSPPAAIRSDQIFVRGVRLPFVKFPRSPNL